MIEFRNKGIFYEAATNQILDDLVAVCQPRRMTVVGDFSVPGRDQDVGEGGVRKTELTIHWGLADWIGDGATIRLSDCRLRGRSICMRSAARHQGRRRGLCRSGPRGGAQEIRLIHGRGVGVQRQRCRPSCRAIRSWKPIGTRPSHVSRDSDQDAAIGAPGKQRPAVNQARTRDGPSAASPSRPSRTELAPANSCFHPSDRSAATTGTFDGTQM